VWKGVKVAVRVVGGWSGRGGGEVCDWWGVVGGGRGGAGGGNMCYDGGEGRIGCGYWSLGG